MKNWFWLILTAMFVLGLAGFAQAQEAFGESAGSDGLRLLEIGKAFKQMPATGSRPEDFVPPHWAITERAEGDLNADGIKDYAFVLMLDEQDTKYLEPLRKLERTDFWIDRTFIIMIIDSRGDRKHHIGAINYDLFGDSGAPARNGDERDEFTLAIKNDVLTINVDFGGMLRTGATFRFRNDRLVGFDVVNTCVTLNENCSKNETSDNYLTGTRIETVYKIQGEKMSSTSRKTKIPPVDVSFMNARLNYANGKGGLQPF